MARQRRLPAPRVEQVVDVRDDAMARLLAARVSFQAAIDAIDEAGACFVNPDTDKGGKERRQLVSDALEAAGSASRALEHVEDTLKDFDKDDWKAAEPWEEDGEEDAGDEEDESEDDED